MQVMITSLKEMLELPNFGHMTLSTIKLNSRDKILMVTSRRKMMMSQHMFQNTFILRGPRIVNFAHIIKIGIMSFNTTFGGSIKVKIMRNYLLISVESISVCLDRTKVSGFR